MPSLNVAVPGRVERIASDLHPRLTAFDHIRERHSMLLKRLAGTGETQADFDRVRERIRPFLSRVEPFEVTVTGVDYFAEPPVGSAPVVYLAVESPGFERLHEALCEEFGTVNGLEGESYTPHVTLARGGSVEDAEALTDVEVEPVSWTVTRLSCQSGKYRETVWEVPLR